MHEQGKMRRELVKVEKYLKFCRSINAWAFPFPSPTYIHTRNRAFYDVYIILSFHYVFQIFFGIHCGLWWIVRKVRSCLLLGWGDEFVIFLWKSKSFFSNELFFKAWFWIHLKLYVTYKDSKRTPLCRNVSLPTSESNPRRNMSNFES